MAKSWDNGDFAYRREIQVDATNIDSDLSAFPLLVKADDDDQIAKANIADGCYAFYDHNGTRLNFEKESYSEGASYANFEIWVNVTTVYASPTGDQNKIWMYYDPTATDGDNVPSSVWDANFVGVWHNAPALLDSTSFGHNETDSGSDDIAGIVGRGRDFVAASDDKITVADDPHLEGMAALTIQCWIRPDNANCDLFSRLVDKVYNGCYAFYYKGGGIYVDRLSGAIVTTGTGGGVTDIGESGCGQDVMDGAWNHVALVWSATTAQINTYVNGVAGTPVARDGDNIATNAVVVAIGARDVDTARQFDGTIDEIRISNTQRTTAWLKFEYHNVAEADFELAWQAEEESAAGAYSLEVDVGAFGLTGQAASPRADRKSVGAVGTFVLSGQTAGVKAGYKTAAALGEFALTGQAVGLKADYKTPGAAGTFALTGQSAGLKAGRRIAGDPGTFLLTGMGAGLLAARYLSAGAGAFALTGKDATLTYSGGGITPAPYFRLLMTK